ncbi:radical SAM additional 4Fe4S-binding SPASM domain-containing protein [Candidatus Magnetomorum sp. HK-1]|nr:radical SAM additional 4Fe4S-binding SPASM domain-containing protein [Candidatus Magnetomorum sp. HK-1]
MIKNYSDCKGHIDNHYQVNILDKIYKVLPDHQKQAFYSYRETWKAAESMKTDYDFPLNLDIELIDACNLQCSFCYRGKAGQFFKHQKRDKFRLGYEKMKNVINECSEHNLPAIWFGASGEGLIEPDVDKMVSYARDKGIIDRILSTNGLLLTKKKAEKLLRSGLTRISISIDANSEKTYSLLRGGNYKKLIENLHNFINIKEKLKLELPIIRLTFVETKENTDEKEAFISYWKDKVDQIDIQKQIFYQEKNLSSQEIEPIICIYPWRAAVLYANGDLALCSSHWGRDSLVMGNIFNLSISQIWNSNNSIALRESIRNHNYCQSCINCMGKKLDRL